MLQKRLKQSQHLHFQNDFLIKFPKEHVQSAPYPEKITIQANKLKTHQGTAHPLYTELGNLLRKITGQTGKLLFAQQSVASFNLMKGDIIGIKTTLRKSRLDFFLEKILFIVHVGDASNVLPLGKAFYHPNGAIQWGSPIYFHKVRFDFKEKFGWNISLSFSSRMKQDNPIAKKFLASTMLILFRT